MSDVRVASTHRMPAEWSPHDATWIAWPHNKEDFPDKLQAVEWVFAEMVRHLHRGERVAILVKNRRVKRRATTLLQRIAVDLSRVDFADADTDRSWTRDYLPLFTVPKGGLSAAPCRAVKFRFNGWARYRDHKLDEKAGLLVARQSGCDVVQPNYDPADGKRARRFVLEGGAIDVDGEGTALVTEQCMLGTQYQRNPGADRVTVEHVLAEHLGVAKVIWLADGIAGDDTSGHIDDLARFVQPGVVVVAQVERGHPDYDLLEDARQRLMAARDAQGRRLLVHTLPQPAPVVLSGEALPASYANFYIGNRVVISPTFNDPNDRVALGTLAELFPTREVVGIHAVDLVSGLGTLHCSTMQQPALGNG